MPTDAGGGLSLPADVDFALLQLVPGPELEQRKGKGQVQDGS